MIISNQLFSNHTLIASSFQQLALFICHLFIDGNFRVTHILHKSNTFNANFLQHIDSICPLTIPIYLTDTISQQHWIELWNQNDVRDNVLQVIFLDAKTISNDINTIENWFAYYRIFAFPSNDMIDVRQRTSVMETVFQIHGFNSLVLHYDAKFVSVYNENGFADRMNMCL